MALGAAVDTDPHEVLTFAHRFQIVTFRWAADLGRH
jgi:hypothetical protein